ncbi:TerD family protein [Streptomyces sp. JJ36]|uniref:TerD family protein n=1 Tax=Streptomyces sp. JJ36 TaxID=2736645 RepID=UPI001F338DA7|nr:TerD family protein [Streptomyces sp. JJ36]MCF6521496.1 TerD family protein [Streptomyces sp. JJ36]
MTAELVRGQNHPLPGTRVEIRVSAGSPVIAGATLGDAEGRLREPGWAAHPGAPRLPGVEVTPGAAAEHRLAVDLGALPEGAHRVHVLLALPSGGPASFAGLPAPSVAVDGPDGAPVAGFTLTGLGPESAVVALELYRRNGAWKVRAIGQGYADGLVALFTDQGCAEAGQLTAAVDAAVAAETAPARHTSGAPASASGAGASASADSASADTVPRPGPAPVPPPATRGGRIDYRHPRRHSAAPRPAAPAAPAAPAGTSADPAPVAGDAPGWSLNERLYNQVWGMFEDLARAVAAYRSAADFADSRRDQELEQVLSDPRTRVGPAAEAARAEAQARHARLLGQAQDVLDGELERLRAESGVVEPALPPAFARWDNPVWQAYEVPMEVPMALRLGDLTLPECADLRIPMLMRLPLERGLWIDSGRGGSVESSLVAPDELDRLAVEVAVAIAARLVAVYPVGDFSLHVVDPAGSAAASLVPLLETGALSEPPAVGAEGVTRVLERLTQRVDLVQMAVRSGATAALPPGLDTGEQLLLVHDFPHGFDDRAVTALRYLADEGPAVGVHLMMVADRAEAREYGPVLDPLWRSLLRLTPVPDEHLADPWVGHAWTYEPPLVPPGSQVVPQVLRRVETARRAYGR